MAIDLDHDQIAQSETQGEKDAVPAGRERTELKNCGIYVPDEIVHSIKISQTTAQGNKQVQGEKSQTPNRGRIRSGARSV
jgi:hypothetical protein